MELTNHVPGPLSEAAENKKVSRQCEVFLTWFSGLRNEEWGGGETGIFEPCPSNQCTPLSLSPLPPFLPPAKANLKKNNKIHPFHHPKVEARSTTRAGQAKKEGIMACNKVKPFRAAFFSLSLCLLKRVQN